MDTGIMTRKIKTRIATISSLLFVVIVAAFLITLPPKGYAPKLKTGSATTYQQKTMYTSYQSKVVVPLTATSTLFIKSLATQNNENSAGWEVGKGTSPGKRALEESSPAKEVQEILRGEENV